MRRPSPSILVAQFVDGTRWCGRALQLVPYVKTMFGAVMALRSACSQAVHNKERCAALAECVRIAAHPRVAHGAGCVRASGIRVGYTIDRAHAIVRACVRACVRCVGVIDVRIGVRRYGVLAAVGRCTTCTPAVLQVARRALHSTLGVLLGYSRGTPGYSRVLQGRSSAAGACRWLEGLCAVLNRIVDAHEKRGAPHTATPTAMYGSKRVRTGPRARRARALWGTPLASLAGTGWVQFV